MEEKETAMIIDQEQEILDKEKETKLIEPSSPGDEFELTAEMMVNDFDDERTLDEEEALEEADEQQSELSNLEKEKDMPIEALLAMYGYTESAEEPSSSPPQSPTVKSGEKSNEKRKRSRSPANTKSCDTVISEESSQKAVEDDASTKNSGETKMKETESQSVVTTESQLNKNKEVEGPGLQLDLQSEVSMDTDVDAVTKEEEEVAANQSITSLDNPEEELAEDDGDKEPPSMLHELYKDDPLIGGSASGARHLRSGSRQQSEEEEEEEEDVDYSPNPDAIEEDWKKTIMVGTDYQAVIPEEGLQKYDDAMPYENEDKLLWDPHDLSDKEIKEFLVGIQSAQTIVPEGVNKIPKGSHVRDDEQALYLFLQCGLNADEAIRRQTINSIPSMTSSSLWSEEECRNFESGLRQYGKEFHTIQQNRVRTRTVSELVQFYYLWKKTERHDLFAVKARLEKKKYILHPGTTDFMERFLDEQDSPNTSPNVHSLLSGDPKRHKTPPLPQINNSSVSASLDSISIRETPTNNHLREREQVSEGDDEGDRLKQDSTVASLSTLNSKSPSSVTSSASTSGTAPVSDVVATEPEKNIPDKNH